MPHFRIVLVEPEYEANLGACARLIKNFDFGELWLVNPKADLRGKEAIKYAKHSKEILENAKIAKSIREAARGCDFIVGTTGILNRWKGAIRNPLTLRQFVEAAGKRRKGSFAILFGREGTGLSEEEISACDFLITIPANDAHPILNLSHALAIVLYELSQFRMPGRRRHFIEKAGEGEKEELIARFEEMMGVVGGEMRYPEKVKRAFRRVVGRSLISNLEAAALLGAFGRIRKRMGKR